MILQFDFWRKFHITGIDEKDLGGRYIAGVDLNEIRFKIGPDFWKNLQEIEKSCEYLLFSADKLNRTNWLEGYSVLDYLIYSCEKIEGVEKNDR